MIQKKLMTLSAVVAAAVLSTNAMADDAQEIELLNSVAVGLTEAVEIAQNDVGGGKAMSAELDDDMLDKPVWEVEVVDSQNMKFDIEVDAGSGEVVSKVEDKY